jgi:hypothetical protein
MCASWTSPIRLVMDYICREGVSQLNGGGYNPKGNQWCHIHLLIGAYSINQNCQRKS